MFPAGRLFTKSVNSFAGTVIAPSSSTFAGTQQFTPISRLVAVSFNRPASVRRRTLLRIGSVPRVETARPTIWSPLVRFSWRQMTFTRPSPLRGYSSYLLSAVAVVALWTMPLLCSARARGPCGQGRDWLRTPEDGARMDVSIADTRSVG
jgi:hypothetical protein